LGFDRFRFARRVDADVLGIFHEDMTKMLSISKATANRTDIMGGTATGDILKLRCNSVDTRPYVLFNGNGDTLFDTYNGMYIQQGGANVLQFVESGTDDTLRGKTANNDLFLDPDGTGVLKFGTHTGSGDVAVNGSIAIKDAAGNARKLATVA